MLVRLVINRIRLKIQIEPAVLEFLFNRMLASSFAVTIAKLLDLVS